MDLHKLPFEIANVEAEESHHTVATLPPEKNEEINIPEMETDTDDVISHIPEELINALKLELENFSKENEILKNILISTADGFEVASLLTSGYELHVRKVSALTSSLLGISSAMLKEVGEGEQNAVFMESDDSMILFNRIPVAQKMLCLMAVTSKDESIGQIFWRVRKLSDNVIEICNKYI